MSTMNASIGNPVFINTLYMAIRLIVLHGKRILKINAIIESEKERRMNRLKGHFGNTIWKKRDKPPENWNSPLPEWMQENYKNSYLEKMKTKEAQEKSEMIDKYCVIM
ncbi:hypothetical protein HZH68_000464 [Vespula germanica]|uniref:Uncharacterized protein n=1 Tax=Vespula germanica TaxID=30212 RepID=A0A834U5V3_VESGE|nr:hypothetical protein HZH68_000464 [Vespula germanica]